MEPNNSPVIDFHAHYARQPDFLPRLLEEMDRAGVDRICLCTAGEGFDMEPNEKVREAFERHPDRIIGLGFVQLGGDPPELVDELHGQGFRGLKLHNPYSGYDDKAFYPVYERAEQHGMPVLFHTGISMRTPADRKRDVNSDRLRPIRADAVARAFPQMNLVLAHLGVPWHEEASTLARLHPNVYVDLTGAASGGWRANKNADFYRYHFWWPGGFEKILFGTDILKVEEYAQAKQWHDGIFRELRLPADTLRKIYGATAARLLRL
jgi:hypothetical protein